LLPLTFSLPNLLREGESNLGLCSKTSQQTLLATLLNASEALIRSLLIFFVMDSNKLLTAAVVVLFVVVIFLGNFVFLLGNQDFQLSEFQKLGVNETLAANAALFVNGKASLSSEFNTKESSHLEDVRNLFTLIKRTYYFFVLFLVVIILYLLKSGKFNYLMPKALILSGVSSLLLLLFVFLASLNFTNFFSIIHKPFFAANTWIFPADSLLIQTFPQQFFQGFARMLFILIAINSSVFLGIGLFVRKKFKQQLPQQVK